MDQLDTSIVYGLLVGVFAASIILYHIKKFSFWSSRGIKGPTPWPFFGTNIYYVLRTKSDVDIEWRRKYGKIYGIYEGYKPTLRNTDNELIKHIYIKNFSSFTDRNTRAIHGDNAKRWLLFSKGDYWANQRAMISPMFTSSKMRLMFDTMSNCIDNFLREADNRISSNKQLDKSSADGDGLNQVKVTFEKKDLMTMTLDVIAQSFFGIKLNVYLDKTHKFLKTGYDFTRVNIGRLVIWFIMPESVARYFKFDLVQFSKFKYFDHLSQSIISERRRQIATGNKQKNLDLIQSFLEAKVPEKYEAIYTQEDDLEAHYNDKIKHEELEKIQEQQTRQATLFRHFSDLEIRGSMTFMFIAGFDATATTINYIIYELSHQQAAQEEVYRELIEIVGNDQSLNYSKLLNLVKLDSFISESMRLYPTIIENNRAVTDDGGQVLPTSPPIRLPKGVVISTNFYILHRDPGYFDRSNEFDLTRFYPENRNKIKSCTYMPFGVGPRNCAGMRFALLEVKLFFAKLLLKYAIHPGPSTQTYPPQYASDMIFLRFKNSDFKLIPREATAA